MNAPRRSLLTRCFRTFWASVCWLVPGGEYLQTHKLLSRFHYRDVITRNDVGRLHDPFFLRTICSDDAVCNSSALLAGSGVTCAGVRIDGGRPGENELSGNCASQYERMAGTGVGQPQTFSPNHVRPQGTSGRRRRRALAPAIRGGHGQSSESRGEPRGRPCLTQHRTCDSSRTKG